MSISNSSCQYPGKCWKHLVSFFTKTLVCNTLHIVKLVQWLSTKLDKKFRQSSKVETKDNYNNWLSKLHLSPKININTWHCFYKNHYKNKIYMSLEIEWNLKHWDFYHKNFSLYVMVLILLIISKSAIHDENYIPTYQTVLRSAIHLTWNLTFFTTENIHCQKAICNIQTRGHWTVTTTLCRNET